MSEKTSPTRLRRLEVVMGFFHAIQAVAVLALANSFALPVTATFLDGPPGSGDTSIETLFDISITRSVAILLFMSAAAHRIISAPGVYPWYIRNLKNSRNYARWIEYSASSSSNPELPRPGWGSVVYGWVGAGLHPLPANRQ
ncbi:MAG: hypothetical protein GY722_13825 [bacterium]|nr:hypothetical protein [bacterium]